MSLYLTIKAIHLLAMVAWFAGLFYLPRLFVYHVENSNKPQCAEMLEVMERRLLRIIMNPAMILTWGLGITLVMMNPEIVKSGAWFHVKMLFVMLLTGYHMSLAWHRKRIAQDKNTCSSKFFRVYNEVPTVFLIIIVLLAVVKPF